ncbi:DUF2637 domain-containing protein [Streptomyces sp. SBT349]|uniref:DUF2637 domain-containing protein n=1 Tax=Streptomyces sp. SBT349 TaxID=1580539 RepID=UPI00099C5DFA|nr:DUF2637 domain-containing protein [Streptomyces sp. SBT349]
MAHTEDTATPPAEINNPTRWNADLGLANAAAAVTIALTAVAFWLSYAHLHDVAGAHGLDGERAWAWPATLDLFIVTGELLMLRAALQRRIDPWAIALTVAGSGGSIALNVFGVDPDAELLDYIVAGIPPTAALLAFGALMRQIHQHLATRVAATSEQPLQSVAPPPLPELPSAFADPGIDAAIEEAMRTVAADGAVELMTVADVARTRGVAEGTVRSWVNRNRLAPARRAADGRLLFHPVAVAELD